VEVEEEPGGVVEEPEGAAGIAWTSVTPSAAQQVAAQVEVILLTSASELVADFLQKEESTAWQFLWESFLPTQACIPVQQVEAQFSVINLA
jgi:hypothetical protein